METRHIVMVMVNQEHDFIILEFDKLVEILKI